MSGPLGAAAERRSFPLVPRRRQSGLPFGDRAGRRPGHGTDVIGLRPYEPGDPVASIDWYATARLSNAHADLEFVVRERAVDVAPRVVLVLDRRPAMALYPSTFPWLSKRDAQVEVAIVIAFSAAAARAEIALLDVADGSVAWLPPGRRDRPWLVAERATDAPFRAPEDGLLQALEFLAQRRTELPAGTFLFVLSDFLVGPGDDAWIEAVGHGWDVVPVVIQDPIWERSWPHVAGVAVPVADPDGRTLGLVRLGRRRVAGLRDRHEERYATTIAALESVGLRPVEIGTSDPRAIEDAFLDWAEERRRGQWRR